MIAQTVPTQQTVPEQTGPTMWTAVPRRSVPWRIEDQPATCTYRALLNQSSRATISSTDECGRRRAGFRMTDSVAFSRVRSAQAAFRIIPVQLRTPRSACIIAGADKSQRSVRGTGERERERLDRNCQLGGPCPEQLARDADEVAYVEVGEARVLVAELVGKFADGALLEIEAIAHV